MAGRAAVPLLCYWDGQVRNGAEGIDYDGPPPRVIRATEEININELVEKIYGITGWDKRHFELEITGRYLAGTTPTRYFIGLPIVDDASIASMFDVTRSPHLGWNCIQLYLKKNPASPDNHLDASENVQSGSFTHLLTQRGEASVFHSSAIFDERRSPSVSADSIGVEDHSEDILAGPTPINYNIPQMNAAKDVTHVVESNTDICDDLRGDNEKALVPDSTNDDQVDKTVISENVPQQQQQQRQLSLQNEEELFVGRKFATKEELQRAVKLYSIKAHHQYTVRDSRPDLYVLKCKQSPDCPWYLRALVRNEKSCFEITRLKGPHTCVDPIINKDHVQLDSGFIANEVKDFVKAGLSVAAIQKVIASRFSHKISYRKAWAARQKAMAQLLSDNEGSSQPSQAKARLGRPKKQQQQQQQSGDNVESSQPSQVKAGRGRPKKKKQADDDDAGLSQQLSQAEASPAPKRKRKKSTS